MRLRGMTLTALLLAASASLATAQTPTNGAMPGTRPGAETGTATDDSARTNPPKTGTTNMAPADSRGGSNAPGDVSQGSKGKETGSAKECKPVDQQEGKC